MAEPTRVVDLGFAAPGGSAPLTWGQREIWKSLRWLGDNDHYFNSAMMFAVPDERSEAEALDAVRAMVERHEGLRTRFPGYATDPVQRVAAEGHLPVAVHDASAADLEPVTKAVIAALQASSFDHEREWPLRVALVCTEGRPRVLVLVVSHLVVDGTGGWVLWNELTGLLSGERPATREGAWGPLALAEYEQGPAGVRRHESSARRWREDLLAMPTSVFDFPTRTPERPRFHDYTLDSPALAVACTRVADALQATNSTVLLTACAAVLGHWTGHEDVGMHLIVANRWRAEVRATVAAMTENGLFTVGLGGLSFAEAVAATWRAALTSFRTAHYDPFAMDRLVEEVEHERGAFCEREAAFFNDMRPTDHWEALPPTAPDEAGLAELVAGSTIANTDRQDRLALKAFFEVLSSPDRATLLLQVDTAYVGPEEAQRLLRGVETLVVRAAHHPVRLADLGALTGIEPVRRGADWVRYGPGWYRPASVEELLRGLDGVDAAALSTEDGGRPVATVVVRDPALTATALHRAVCAALRERTDAIAPAHYTVQASGPEPQPVLDKGTGRATLSASDGGRRI